MSRIDDGIPEAVLAEAEAAIAASDHDFDWTPVVEALREALIAIRGGCGCPAPYTECPHVEPLLPALNDARSKLARLRVENEKLQAIVDEWRAFCVALDADVPAAGTATSCTHPNRAFTIGGPGDSDGYVWCPDCRTNLTAESEADTAIDPHYPDQAWVWADGNYFDAVVIHREWRRYQQAAMQKDPDYFADVPTPQDTPRPTCVDCAHPWGDHVGDGCARAGCQCTEPWPTWPTEEKES